MIQSPAVTFLFEPEISEHGNISISQPVIVISNLHTLCTLHHTSIRTTHYYTTHYTQCITCTIHTIHYTLYTTHYTLCTLYTMYNLYYVHYTLYTIHYTLYTMYNLCYTLYTIHYALYTIHYTQCITWIALTTSQAVEKDEERGED